MRVIFSAGGTGGHLYPALALAKYMKEIDVNCQILFVGSIYRIESHVVEENGFAFKGLDVKTPSGSVFSKLRGYLDVFRNIKTCKQIIRDFKPDLVFGFGGYTSYSIMEAANSLSIPTLIHEQNAIVGRSNKVLAKKAQAIISSFDIKDQVVGTRVLQLGNPVVYHIAQSKPLNLKTFDLNDDIQTVLIVMGSQGSLTIDRVIRNLFDKWQHSAYQIIYISGPNYYLSSDKKLNYSNIRVLPYSNDLASLIKSCDLIISRAGASSLSEIAFALKPMVLIPSIYVTNNHQYLNALAYVDVECAVIIEENDHIQNDLYEKVDELLNNPQKLNKMIKSCHRINNTNVVTDIYKIMLEIAGEKSE